MTRFAFTRRVTTEAIVWFEAEDEVAAWSKALMGAEANATTDEQLTRLPIFNRAPQAGRIRPMKPQVWTAQRQQEDDARRERALLVVYARDIEGLRWSTIARKIERSSARVRQIYDRMKHENLRVSRRPHFINRFFEHDL